MVPYSVARTATSEAFTGNPAVSYDEQGLILASRRHWNHGVTNLHCCVPDAHVRGDGSD